MIKVLQRLLSLTAGTLLPIVIYVYIFRFLPKDVDGGVPFDEFVKVGLWLSAVGGVLCGLLQPRDPPALLINLTVSPGTIIMLLVGVFDFTTALAMASSAWGTLGIVVLIKQWGPRVKGHSPRGRWGSARKRRLKPALSRE